MSFQGEGHSGAVSGIVAVRSQELLTCSYDRTVRLWDTRTKYTIICFSLPGSHDVTSELFTCNRKCRAVLNGGNGSVTSVTGDNVKVQ